MSIKVIQIKNEMLPMLARLKNETKLQAEFQMDLPAGELRVLVHHADGTTEKRLVYRDGETYDKIKLRIEAAFKRT